MLAVRQHLARSCIPGRQCARFVGTRTETDGFGPLEVPSDKYYGAQTARSIMNFPIGWEKQHVAIVRALGVIRAIFYDR